MVNLLVKTESSNENNYFQIDILKFRFFFWYIIVLKQPHLQSVLKVQMSTIKKDKASCKWW